MSRLSAACAVLFVIASVASVAAQACPPGVPAVQCFADPCQVRSEPCPKGTTCASNYCGGCNSECVADASTSSPAPTAAGSDAPPTCPDGKVRKCSAVCNMMCIKGTACSVDPCTCKPTCKPVEPPKQTTPAAGPDTAPRCPDGKMRKCPGCNKMCRRGYTCSVDPCTCRSSCKPMAAPKQPAPKQPTAALPIEAAPSNPCENRGCAAVRCIAGTRCVEDPKTCSATCAPDTPAAAAVPKTTTPAVPKPCARKGCAVQRCRKDQVCQEDSKTCKAKCVAKPKPTTRPQPTTASPKPTSQPGAAAPAPLFPPSTKCVRAHGSCAVARCIAGTNCMEDGDCRAHCVPEAASPAVDKCANSIGCAATTCLVGNDCKVDPNTCQAICVPATKG